tara:strand:- start:837 stop:998 length:162 start_codon:yes stop_codon:yes gene_type:complete
MFEPLMFKTLLQVQVIRSAVTPFLDCAKVTKLLLTAAARRGEHKEGKAFVIAC